MTSSDLNSPILAPNEVLATLMTFDLKNNLKSMDTPLTSFRFRKYPSSFYDDSLNDADPSFEVPVKNLPEPIKAELKKIISKILQILIFFLLIFNSEKLTLPRTPKLPEFNPIAVSMQLERRDCRTGRSDVKPGDWDSIAPKCSSLRL